MHSKYLLGTLLFLLLHRFGPACLFVCSFVLLSPFTIATPLHLLLFRLCLVWSWILFPRFSVAVEWVGRVRVCVDYSKVVIGCWVLGVGYLLLLSVLCFAFELWDRNRNCVLWVGSLGIFRKWRVLLIQRLIRSFLDRSL